MTVDQEISLLIEEWLEDGPVEMPERVIGVVGVRIARQRQRWSWRVGWSPSPRVQPWLAFVAVMAMTIVALWAIGVSGRGPAVVPPVAPSTGPSGAPTRTPTIRSGQIVVELTDTNIENQIRFIASDGRALPLLPDFGGHQRTAVWRPDGRRLAFAGQPGNDPDPWMSLYETDAQGSPPRLLSTDCTPPACVEETDPAYSPDGSRLVAVRLADLRDGQPTRSVLVVYDLVTGRATEIPDSSFAYQDFDIGHPRWSPDGRRVVFHLVKDPPTERRRLIFPEPRPPGPSSIEVIGVDGSGRRQVTPDGLESGDPDWSPDGSSIVFGPASLHLWIYGLDQTDWQISTIHPDGSGLHVIVPGPDAATPSWTADGTSVLFIQASGSLQAVRAIAPDGSGVRDVATFGGRDIVTYPIQQPTP